MTIALETPSILNVIAVRKRQDLALRKTQISEESLRNRVRATDLNLEAALRKDHPSFIMECKRRSPSQGELREDFNLDAIVDSYIPFADAISVLTDEPFFGGSFNDLSHVRARTNAPILCKDFILEPYQILEARLHGADGVLLMLSLLDDASWKRCHALAKSLNMSVLTETHTREEMQRAIDLGASLIGVNNRDLHTLRVDLSTSHRLSDMVPKDRVLISESGIKTHDDVKSLAHRFDGFLVGTSLIKSDSLDEKIRELLFSRIKICGLTTSEDCHDAWNQGASYGGLIFAEQSKRHINLDTATNITFPTRMKKVGVFADQEISLILDHVQHLHLDVVQLHGSESQEYRAKLSSLLAPTMEIWQAKKVMSAGDALPNVQLHRHADHILLEGFHPKSLGGSGSSFDWTLLHNYPHTQQIWVAGGIRPENLTRILQHQPWGVDICSGVESSPGKKDCAKMSQLFKNARGLSSSSFHGVES